MKFVVYRDLSYAKSLGYDLNDIIRPQHTLK